jgi:hypothetical protein
MEKQITTLTQLSSYSEGQIVELPPFAEGQPFVARLRRPSMLDLAKHGKIPNSLLNTANGLFSGKAVDSKNKAALRDLFDVLDIFCEDCFLEPTYQDIKNAGVRLTDDQLMFVFNYAQMGVKSLETFRVQPGNNATTGGSTEVQTASV